MKFNVNGDVRELIARGYAPGLAFNALPDITAEVLEDLLEGKKAGLLNHQYKVSESEFAAMQSLVDLNNENVERHLALSPEQLERYEDWEMTRCVNTQDIMLHKEEAFLDELTGQ